MRPAPQPATEANATSNAALKRCETDCIGISNTDTIAGSRGRRFPHCGCGNYNAVRDRGFPAQSRSAPLGSPLGYYHPLVGQVEGTQLRVVPRAPTVTQEAA